MNIHEYIFILYISMHIYIRWYISFIWGAHKLPTRRPQSRISRAIAAVGKGVRCSAVNYAAVCCSVLQCTELHCSVLQRVAVCCSVLHCVAVCCSALLCVAMRCSGKASALDALRFVICFKVNVWGFCVLAHKGLGFRPSPLRVGQCHHNLVFMVCVQSWAHSDLRAVHTAARCASPRDPQI